MAGGAEEQRDSDVAERLATARRHHRITAVIMGVAVASLAVHQFVVVIVATLLVMAGTVRLVGTPVNLRLLPSEGRGAILVVLVGGWSMFALLTVGLAGQQLNVWWLPVLAGVVMTPAAIAVGRWRLAQLGRALAERAGR
jgi:hypothetical protein